MKTKLEIDEKLCERYKKLESLEELHKNNSHIPLYIQLIEVVKADIATLEWVLK